MVRIAIVGGGIGGLTAALALREFGFESEVYEQAPALLDVGAAIALWPNALRVLERLGLKTTILNHAGEMEEIRWLDQRGALLNRVSIPQSVALHRADLQSTLFQALATPVIKLGHTFAAYDDRKDNVVASFTQGEEIETDVLIGADGIHSKIRAQILKDNQPIYRGYTVWRGISSVLPDSIPANTAVEIHGRGKRFGIGPVGNGRAGWWAAANLTWTPSGAASERAAHNAHDELLRLFKGWPSSALQLIESTPPERILTTPAFDRDPNQTWGNGRITLLGDAIHPTTPNLGQGGCLAMEDALVLARCFAKYGATEEALRKYEGCRYQRTAAITKYSRFYGNMGQWENPLARGCKTFFLSLTPESVLQRLMQTVFDYDANTVTV
jgi:2-polyprenyl-6-methoxyphenol hydroxylase-like FAD-dependent oxidoreductase